MNTQSLLKKNAPGKNGVALIIVLSIIVLLSGLLVAFMSSVGTESASAKASVRGIEARQIAESAVNLAISQIREATRGDANAPTAWASQPGVIRQFDDKGKDKRVYKLYSARDMVVEDGQYPPGFNPSSPGAAVAPAAVMAEAGMVAGEMEVTPTGFVDMNFPELVPVTGNPSRVYVRYPIVDPRASEGLPGVKRSATTVPTRVQGFAAADIRHPNTDLTDAGQFAFSDRQIRLLPMRVRWLFQLRDGTLIPGVEANPGVNDGKIKVEGATEQNPIVGRIAFWTDDETGKICINTASENTFWDTPHTSTIQDAGFLTAAKTLNVDARSLALGASQPARGEYQRFPGHPATTSLSPALRWMFGAAVTDQIYKEAIYRMIPRVIGGQGSSLAGTAITEYVTDARVYERDRLFSSLDEFWFRPDRTPLSMPGLYNVFSGGTKDLAQTSGIFTPEAIEMMRFFLTASNRSSDLNLWGMPKVSIWPVHSTDDPNPKTSRRSGFDDLISFCATTGSGTNKKTYYFTRNSPWSPTVDISLPRNVQLLDYLTSLTDKKVPGVGASFANKYATLVPPAYNAVTQSTERDQILTEIFDYIRSTNLVDTGRKDGSPAPPQGVANYPLAFTPGYGSLNGATKPQLGSGQVVPSQRIVNGAVTSMGFGRFVTVSEVAILFYFDNAAQKILPGDSDVPADLSKSTPMRAVVLVEMTTPAPGYPCLSEGYAYTITETTPFKIASDVANPASLLNLDLGTGETNMVEVDTWRGPYGRFFMPTRGFGNHFWYDQSINAANPTAKKFWRNGAVGTAPGDAYSYYPFFSRRFSMTIPGTKDFFFKGGEFRIDLHALNPSFTTAGSSVASFHPPKGPKLQSLFVRFPETTLLLPLASTPFQNRITDIGARGDRNKALGWIAAGDTVRSMELNGVAKADTRLAAARPVVPVEMFSPAVSDAEYRNKNTQRVNNLRISWGARYSGARQGVYAIGGTARSDKTVDLPAQYNGVPLGGTNAAITGDYDRGMSKHIDGAFINKADEGNTRYNFDAGDLASGGGVPYFRGGNGYEETGQTYFSPNRLISSAVMFGSLPTGVYSMQPWQTLLFRPGYGGHKGAQAPSDHYLLDLFSMPVVEPYAISEPLSTQGRQNLNCRLAPFGYVPANGTGDPITSPAYIERTTGLHAVLKGMYQMAVPNGTAEAAHSEAPYNGASNAAVVRYPVDPYETIEQGIIKKNYFKTPSQICDIDLLMVGRNLTGNPTEGANNSNRQAFWEAHNMTGDNMRERPYSHIYPRLTTKSNTYTVYVYAQSVSKKAKKNWDEFDEAEDLITGEYRGSSTVERFIDPNGADIQNYDAVAAAKANQAGLDSLYRFRIINTKQFVAR